MRHMLLITKIIQNLANGVEFKKERFMIELNPFIQANLSAVKTFLSDLSVFIYSFFNFFFIIFLQQDAKVRNSVMERVEWSPKETIESLDTLIFYFINNIEKFHQQAQEHKMVNHHFTPFILKYSSVISLVVCGGRDEISASLIFTTTSKIQRVLVFLLHLSSFIADPNKQNKAANLNEPEGRQKTSQGRKENTSEYKRSRGE